jgi:hypothetical protein
MEDAMSKLDALVSISQTVLRFRGHNEPTMGMIANTVNECASLLPEADGSFENAAIVELARRMGTSTFFLR